MDFNLQLAARLAQASADAYHAATVDAPGTDTQVLVTEKGVTCFSFRGTSDFRDALTDANILLTGAPDLPVREGRLHHGCVRAVESVIPQLAKICRELPDGQPLYFTGHSLGGALAPLAAYLLALEGFNVAGVITFAGMRFADPVFRRNYHRVLGDRTWRVVAQYDVVPHLPLPGWLLPYRHVGTEVYLKTAPSVAAPGEIPTLKLRRSPVEILLADVFTLANAWRLARFNPLAIPGDVAAMHAMSRYQKLIDTLTDGKK